jgi:hypothetical protein
LWSKVVLSMTRDRKKWQTSIVQMHGPSFHKQDGEITF